MRTALGTNSYNEDSTFDSVQILLPVLKSQLLEEYALQSTKLEQSLKSFQYGKLSVSFGETFKTTSVPSKASRAMAMAIFSCVYCESIAVNNVFSHRHRDYDTLKVSSTPVFRITEKERERFLVTHTHTHTNKQGSVQRDTPCRTRVPSCMHTNHSICRLYTGIWDRGGMAASNSAATSH